LPPAGTPAPESRDSCHSEDTLVAEYSFAVSHGCLLILMSGDRGFASYFPARENSIRPIVMDTLRDVWPNRLSIGGRRGAGRFVTHTDFAAFELVTGPLRSASRARSDRRNRLSYLSTRSLNLRTSIMARSCVPSPIIFSPMVAFTLNCIRRLFTAISSARKQTLLPIGAAAR